MPINTSQITDATLSAVTGFKNIQNQAEGNLLSAEGNLITAKSQEAQADKEYTDAIATAYKFENENPNLSDENVVNQNKINDLQAQEQELNKLMFEKHPKNEKGRFISQLQHQENVSKKLTQVNQDLEMARKAQDVITNKLLTRAQLGKTVETRKIQLEAAKTHTERATTHLAKVQKDTKWLVGGKK